LEKYLALGKAEQPSADLLGAFCNRVAALAERFEFLILTILSEYTQSIKVSAIPLSKSLINACAGICAFGLEFITIKEEYVGDGFLSALASSEAAKSLRKLSLTENGLSDSSRHLWSKFPNLSGLNLLNAEFISTASIESIVSNIPTLTQLFIVCVQLELDPILRIVVTRPCFERFGAHFSDPDLDDETFAKHLDLLRSWEGRERLVFFDVGRQRARDIEPSQGEQLLKIFPNMTRIRGAFYDENRPDLLRPRGAIVITALDDAATHAIEQESTSNIELSTSDPFKFSRVPHFSRLLKRFHLEADQLSGDLDQLVAALVGCKKLQDVSLRILDGLTKVHVRALLTELPCLKSLTAQNQNASGVGVLHIAHATLRATPQVRVNDCNKVVVVWLPMARLIWSPVALNSLRLPNVRVAMLRLALPNAGDVASHAPNLATISLTKSPFPELSTGFWALQMITSDHNQWEVGQLERILAQCPLLTTLRIPNSCVFSHRRLKILKLMHVHFYEDGPFRVVPETLPSLQHLTLENVDNLNELEVSDSPNMRFLDVSHLKSASELRVMVSNCPDLRVLRIQFLKHPIQSLCIVGVPQVKEITFCSGQLEQALIAGRIKLQLPRTTLFQCDSSNTYSSEIQSVIESLEDNTLFVPDTKNCSPYRVTQED
jgi:hypothetical protein